MLKMISTTCHLKRLNTTKKCSGYGAMLWSKVNQCPVSHIFSCIGYLCEVLFLGLYFPQNSVFQNNPMQRLLEAPFCSWSGNKSPAGAPLPKKLPRREPGTSRLLSRTCSECMLVWLHRLLWNCCGIKWGWIGHAIFLLNYECQC